MAHDANFVLKFSNVSKYFETKKGNFSVSSIWQRDSRLVLDKIDFGLKRGEIVGLIGLNGAGKSTLLRLACGILRPTSGGVELFGTRLLTVEKNSLSKIGYVMGSRSRLIWDLPGLQSFNLHRVLYRLSKVEFSERMGFLLEVFELTEILNEPVRNLSLGQRMRLDIALSLLHRPSLLLLDEATLALDVRAKAFFADAILRSCRQFGTAAIFASNEMSDIRAISSRVMLLDRSRIFYDGGMEGLFSAHGRFHTIILRCGDNVKAGGLTELSELLGATLHPGKDGEELRVIVKSEEEKLMLLRQAQPFIGNQIVSVDVREPSLENLVASLRGK